MCLSLNAIVLRQDISQLNERLVRYIPKLKEFEFNSEIMTCSNFNGVPRVHQCSQTCEIQHVVMEIVFDRCIQVAQCLENHELSSFLMLFRMQHKLDLFESLSNRFLLIFLFEAKYNPNTVNKVWLSLIMIFLNNSN